jgi:cyclopropane fatty-acyl-phospholipid synthase-like methyltransferase
MKKDLDSSIAFSLDANPELLPYLPELLADFIEIGGAPKDIVNMLKKHITSKEFSVLDLGCGKGAVSCAIAKELGAKVKGYDGFEPFILSANEYAEKLGVASFCKFTVADIRDVVEKERGYDVVILAGVGLPWGGIKETIEVLRSCIKPGGFIVFDDAFLSKDTIISDKRYSLYKYYEETISELTYFGDEIVEEKILTHDEAVDSAGDDVDKIKSRAEKLAVRFPDKADLFKEYVKVQENEVQLLHSELVYAFWMIKKN